MMMNGPSTRLSSVPGRRVTSISSLVMNEVIRTKLLALPRANAPSAARMARSTDHLLRLNLAVRATLSRGWRRGFVKRLTLLVGAGQEPREHLVEGGTV